MKKKLTIKNLTQSHMDHPLLFATLRDNGVEIEYKNEIFYISGYAPNRNSEVITPSKAWLAPIEGFRLFEKYERGEISHNECFSSKLRSVKHEITWSFLINLILKKRSDLAYTGIEFVKTPKGFYGIKGKFILSK